MSRDVSDEVGFPDLPAFRPRATRWAVWRGVMRTAFLAALYLLLAVIVLNVGGAGLLALGGRQHHLTHVVEIAWKVAHPEFVERNGSFGPGIVHYTDGIGAAPLEAQGSGPITDVRLRENLFGTLSGSHLDPPSRADGVLRQLGHANVVDLRAAERKELQQLPAPVEVAAVVEFANPLTEAEYDAFARGTVGNLVLATMLFSNPPTQEDLFNSRGPFVRGVYGWGFGTGGGAFSGGGANLAHFQKWVSTLHDSDRGALARVGVDLTDVRAAARDGRIHGVIVTDEAPTDLLKLLDDPRVGAVHPYDIQFRVEGSS